MGSAITSEAFRPATGQVKTRNQEVKQLKKECILAAGLTVVLSVFTTTPSFALGKVCTVYAVEGVAKANTRNKAIRKAKRAWADVARTKYGKTMGLTRAIKTEKNKTCEPTGTAYICTISAHPCRRPTKNFLSVNNKCLPEPDYRTAKANHCKWFKK